MEREREVVCWCVAEAAFPSVCVLLLCCSARFFFLFQQRFFLSLLFSLLGRTSLLSKAAQCGVVRDASSLQLRDVPWQGIPDEYLGEVEREMERGEGRESNRDQREMSRGTKRKQSRSHFPSSAWTLASSSLLLGTFHVFFHFRDFSVCYGRTNKKEIAVGAPSGRSQHPQRDEKRSCNTFVCCVQFRNGKTM